MSERLPPLTSSAPHRVKLATPFLRYVALLAANANPQRGNMQAAKDAETFAATTPEVGRLLTAARDSKINLRDHSQFITKAAISAGTTQHVTWASPLLDHAAIMGQFLELLRPATILGRLTTRPIAFNEFAALQTAGAIASWVGEGEPIPMSAEGFAGYRLDPHRLAVITTVTKELQRFTDPAALAALQDDLILAIAEATDKSFIDPSLAATANRPASITNGVTPRNSTGSSIAQITADLQAAAQSLIDAGSTLQNASWILNPTTALSLSALRGTTGDIPFPDVSVRGGVLLGLNVIVSATSAPSGSPGDRTIALVDGSRILVADAGIVVDASENASLQFSDTPANVASQLTSLWQENKVGVRCQRILNWLALPGAVALIENVTY